MWICEQLLLGRGTVFAPGPNSTFFSLIEGRGKATHFLGPQALAEAAILSIQTSTSLLLEMGKRVKEACALTGAKEACCIMAKGPFHVD